MMDTAKALFVIGSLRASMVQTQQSNVGGALPGMMLLGPTLLEDIHSETINTTATIKKHTVSRDKLTPSEITVFKVLTHMEDKINSELLLSKTPANDWVESSTYRFDGLFEALKVMVQDGVAGKKFYMGDDVNTDARYGLVNLAAFLAQSMKETIMYDACDENNWDLIDNKYPLSNACGQLGQDYGAYSCPAGQEHLSCDVDPEMRLVAATNAKWYGAPAPLFCEPKDDSENGFTGYWDYTLVCNNPWADPPMTCSDYEGQQGGGFVNHAPMENRNGRSDVEGCCWWGRGVIQTTGPCNFGRLNYYLGARAADEGRSSKYPDIDFCKDPEAICSSQKYPELKWIAGLFYWLDQVQEYSVGGWSYKDNLEKFVEGGMTDPSFIESVSGIVNRGCHNPPCATGAVDGGYERRGNFDNALNLFTSDPALFDQASEHPAIFITSSTSAVAASTMTTSAAISPTASTTTPTSVSTAANILASTTSSTTMSSTISTSTPATTMITSTIPPLTSTTTEATPRDTNTASSTSLTSSTLSTGAASTKAALIAPTTVDGQSSLTTQSSLSSSSTSLASSTSIATVKNAGSSTKKPLSTTTIDIHSTHITTITTSKSAPKAHLDKTNLYYPDYSDSTCYNNDSQPSWQKGYVALASSLESCCNGFFSPLQFSHCMEKKTALFYPDFLGGYCRNDGAAPSWMAGSYLKSSMVQCCHLFFTENADECEAHS